MSTPISYDLHIHSCLSPCGDVDMTPNNIVNMAVLCGLQLIAITDHNSTRNCPAALKVAKNLPITVLCGMELTTSEGIHVVFILPDLERALEFDKYVHARLDKVENQHEIFGEQIVMNEHDIPTDTERFLLVGVTDISIDHTYELAKQFGGICWPAHIDRASTSLMSIFGMVPPDLPHPTLEVHQPEMFFESGQHNDIQTTRKIITNSDSHMLTQIAGTSHIIEMESCDFEGLKLALGW